MLHHHKSPSIIFDHHWSSPIIVDNRWSALIIIDPYGTSRNIADHCQSSFIIIDHHHPSSIIVYHCSSPLIIVHHNDNDSLSIIVNYFPSLQIIFNHHEWISDYICYHRYWTNEYTNIYSAYFFTFVAYVGVELFQLPRRHILREFFWKIFILTTNSLISCWNWPKICLLGNLIYSTPTNATKINKLAYEK